MKEQILIPERSAMLDALKIPVYEVRGRPIRPRVEHVKYLNKSLAGLRSYPMPEETREKVERFCKEKPKMRRYPSPTGIDKLFLLHHYGDTSMTTLAKTVGVHPNTMQRVFQKYGLPTIPPEEAKMRARNPNTLPNLEKKKKLREIVTQQQLAKTPEERKLAGERLHRGRQQITNLERQKEEERLIGITMRLNRDCKMTVPERIMQDTILAQIAIPYGRASVDNRHRARPGQVYYADSRENKTAVLLPDDHFAIPDFVVTGLDTQPIGVIEVFGGVRQHQEEFGREAGLPEVMWNPREKEKQYRQVGIPALVLVNEEVTDKELREHTLARVRTFIYETVSQTRKSPPAFMYPDELLAYYKSKRKHT